MGVRPRPDVRRVIGGPSSACKCRGLCWIAGTEPQAWRAGLMNDITYDGLDVHKATVCVAIAESGRGGEVREVGVFEKPAQNGCSDWQASASPPLLLRSRSLWIWTSPFADRVGARLRRGGTIADSDEGGRPGQDRSP